MLISILNKTSLSHAVGLKKTQQYSDRPVINLKERGETLLFQRNSFNTPIYPKSNNKFPDR